MLRADELVVFDSRTEIARHERSTVRGSVPLLLDHYLEVLAHKPGALPGAIALVQARACGAFTSAHDAFWAAARKAHGDAAGTRELVEVLLLHRQLAAVDVVDGLTAALGVGAVRADVVAVEARRIADQRPTERTSSTLGTAEVTPARIPSARVASLTERRLADPTAVIAGLPSDARPAPTVTAYDELLTRRRTPPTTATAPAQASSEGQVS